MTWVDFCVFWKRFIQKGKTFLYELLCEIINTYKPDGINLDYIRYPQSLATSFSNYDMSNWG